jgi:hypothetical protein
MTVLLRLDDDREELVEFDELTTRIKNGQVGPGTLAKGKFLTNDRWEPLNETEFFHRRSPVRCDAGPRLAAKRAEAQAREELGRRRVEFLAHAPPLNVQLGIEPVDVLARKHRGWVARLWTIPCFEPLSILTVLQTELKVQIELVEPIDPDLQIVGGVAISRRSRLADAVFSANPDSSDIEPSIFDVPTKRRSAVRPPQALRTIIERISANVQAALSCSTLTLDGVEYRHECASFEGEVVAAEWSNPDPEVHVAQVSIVRAYNELSKSALF